MADSRAWIELSGTTPEPLAGSFRRPEGPDLGETITVTIVVRSQVDDAALAEAVDAVARQSPQERTRLSREDFARRYGCSEADLDAVRAFAVEQGLAVVEVSAARCAVEVSGSLAAFNQAFGVRFEIYDSATGPYRSYDGPIRIPQSLSGIIRDVLGFDDRPILEPFAAAAELTELKHTDPRTVADFYQFPPGATGKGQCVAILEFGGGYHLSDLEIYFPLRGLPVPRIELVELGGQHNKPADKKIILDCAEKLTLLPPGSGGNPCACTTEHGLPFWGTIECSINLQFLGTLLPDACLVVYMAPNTAKGMYDAFSRALADSAFAPSVINCSWGSCENKTPLNAMASLNQLLLQAVLQGVTVCASAGNFGNGAARCGKPTGHFPATSPYVLACGGTSVALDIWQETTWWETLAGGTLLGGGGFSEVFERPWWQQDVVPGEPPRRGFPDVAAKADIRTGYDVVVTGLDLPMGGTSCAAPMWAALIARINQIVGYPVGLITPLLYMQPSAGATRKIVLSGGGSCVPLPLWDPCTGLGSPVGTKLLAALSPDSPDPGSG